MWTKINTSGGSTSDYSKYSGKNYISFGDSITNRGTPVERNYTYHLSAKLGTTLTNNGSSGSGTARMKAIVKGETLGGTTYIEPNYSTCDIVTIMIGHNEAVGSSAINDINGITDYNLYPSTYYGNVCACIEHILTKNQNIKIYLLTPIQSIVDPYITNSEQATAALKEIGKKYALPVIDLHNTCGLHFRNLGLHTSDGTHPLESGAKMIAEVATRQMLSY